MKDWKDWHSLKYKKTKPNIFNTWKQWETRNKIAAIKREMIQSGHIATIYGATVICSTQKKDK